MVYGISDFDFDGEEEEELKKKPPLVPEIKVEDVNVVEGKNLTATVEYV